MRKTNTCPIVSSGNGILPVVVVAPFELGRWSDTDIGSNGIELEVAPEFANVTSLDNSNYLTHIGELFQRWNNAMITATSNGSNKRYINIGNNVNSPVALSVNQNKDLNSTNDYANDGEIGVYVKGTFDLNINEGEWFNNLDSRILALVSYQAIARSSSDCYNYNEIVHADLIFNASDHAFAAFDKAVPQNPSNYFDFDAVMIHELGHFLGILDTLN